MQELFIKRVQSIVMRTLEKMGLLVNEWHLGKVKIVNVNGTLDVYIDGGTTATPSIPSNPMIKFSVNDYVWVQYVNRNANNLFIPAKRFIDGVQYNAGTNPYDSVYAAKTHNHDGTYSPVAHNHDTAYAPLTHSHTALGIVDNRSVVSTPSDHSRGIDVSFKNSATVGLTGADTYSLVMGLAPWNDDSGGGNYELAFSAGSMYMRYGTRTDGWGVWKKVTMV